MRTYRRDTNETQVIENRHRLKKIRTTNVDDEDNQDESRVQIEDFKSVKKKDEPKLTVNDIDKFKVCIVPSLMTKLHFR